MLYMLLACIYSYLKSVLRYSFLILDTYHPSQSIYVSKDPWLLLEAKWGSMIKKVWKTLF